MDDDLEWDVLLVDAGCDCCSYLHVASFATLAEAETWVAEKSDPTNYVIDHWCDE